MSSFFTLPVSPRKRKREDGSAAFPVRKRVTAVRGTARTDTADRRSRPKRDESISSGDSEAEGKGAQASHGGLTNSDSDTEDETGAERRLRLAEQYLQNVKGEVDEGGFDAVEVDKDIIAERLQEDVAETKGRLYRHIAADLDIFNAVKTQFRSNTDTTTALAVCSPYVYTVSKDIALVKWELPTPSPHPRSSKLKRPLKRAPPPKGRRPIKLFSTSGDRKRNKDPSYNHHTASILTVAASSSGKFVATGGADKRLIVWSAADLAPLRVFTQHRDAVTSLAFRRGTNQLYSASKDRTIKTWSIDELAYVETLFGHQDEVVDVAALAREQCVSVGARDRTARLWKVVEETQLVFRGGGGGGGGGFEKGKQQAHVAGKEEDGNLTAYREGSIDRVALVDEETFVTGSDNGAISLWTLRKKKPVFTVRAAHGLDPLLRPEEAYAEENPSQEVPGEPQPRWITSLATVPYSDLILSGSWDGEVRAWRVSDDKRKIVALGTVGEPGLNPTTEGTMATSERKASIRGIVNDIEVFERGDRGRDGLCIVVATGREHRLGRWKKIEGRNGAVVIEVPRLPQRRTDQTEEALADKLTL